MSRASVVLKTCFRDIWGRRSIVSYCCICHSFGLLRNSFFYDLPFASHYQNVLIHVLRNNFCLSINVWFTGSSHAICDGITFTSTFYVRNNFFLFSLSVPEVPWTVTNFSLRVEERASTVRHSSILAAAILQRLHLFYGITAATFIGTNLMCNADWIVSGFGGRLVYSSVIGRTYWWFSVSFIIGFEQWQYQNISYSTFGVPHSTRI